MERVSRDGRSSDRETVSGGGVTVVALLQASSVYSRQHALSLNELTSRVSSVNVVGVNSRHTLSRLMASQLTQLTNLTILQSGSGLKDAWSRLGGLKDDVFIYDS